MHLQLYAGVAVDSAERYTVHFPSCIPQSVVPHVRQKHRPQPGTDS